MTDLMTIGQEVWTGENYQTIKDCFAKGVTDSEFKVFVEIGKRCNLNPFLKEIWALKYGNNPASIFIGRDGYRKAAQAHPEYEHHEAHSVYENDSLQLDSETGLVKHEFSLTDRGDLVGAFALVRKKGVSRPFFKFVYFAEYTTNQSLWKSKPDTMIIKVAEAQCLKMAFQDIFGGTYSEAEQWKDKKDAKEMLSTLIEKVDENKATKDSVSELRQLIQDNEWAIGASINWLKKAAVKSFDDMTQEQVNACIKLVKSKQIANVSNPATGEVV
jgi:phage recombination protein Bet